MKLKIYRRLIYECRWDERLKGKVEGSTPLGCTVEVLVYLQENKKREKTEG